MRKKLWIAGYLIIVITLLCFAAYVTADIDPYFHYHAPKTDSYYYTLEEERCQNYGILEHFDYEGVITGTSMTQNFKTSEAEKIWGVPFVKVSSAGATFKEINGELNCAAENNPDLKYVIRSVDMNKFFDDKDMLRTDLGTYPTYLYDDCVLNDAPYVFNRSLLFKQIYPMVSASRDPDAKVGITSFDDYDRWQEIFKYGREKVLETGLSDASPAKSIALSPEEADSVLASIQQNMTALARQYPDITFYYFMTPYSAAWWHSLLLEGTLDKQIDAERIVIEELLTCANIKLFSINCLFDLTTDLNNYKDDRHYGGWINTLLLHYMHDGKYQLTTDNYLDYLEEERQFYKSFDYSQLMEQQDYEDDLYAAELIDERIAAETS